MDSIPPVVLREWRRMVRRPGTWLLVTLISGFVLLAFSTVDGVAAAGCAFGGIVAAVGAHRCMAAEVTEDTVDLLATAPISLESIALQVGFAHASVWALVSLTLVLVSASHNLWSPLDDWVRWSGMVAVFATMCSLGRFSTGPSGVTFYGLVLATMVLGACVGVVAVVVNAPTYLVWPLHFVIARIVVFLIVHLNSWAMGPWPESVLEVQPNPPARDGDSAAPCAGGWGFSRPIPDCLSPILWWELRGRIKASFCVGLVSCFLFMLFVPTGAEEFRVCGFIVGGVLAALLALVIVLIAVSTIHTQRQSGFWAEVLVTGLGVRSQLVGARVAAWAILALGALFPIFALVAAGPGSGGDPHAAWLVVGPMLAWILAALCGLIGGLVARGVLGYLVALLIFATALHSTGFDILFRGYGMVNVPHSIGGLPGLDQCVVLALLCAFLGHVAARIIGRSE